ncbi:hypothetical protein BGW39_006336 [Mortierella sp. 14UC]|nr:hypothetical protein BGW39_006336 [Mortierella sp. 14UC]
MMNENIYLSVQAVRRVYENENEKPSSSSTATPAGIIHLVCEPDATSGKEVILWDDILAAFSKDTVLYVRFGTVVLPFLKGPGYKNLEPLRIAKIGRAILDVVVRRGRSSEKELFAEFLLESLPTYQESSSKAGSVSAPTTIFSALTLSTAGSVVGRAAGKSAPRENAAHPPDERELQGVPYPIATFYRTVSSRMSHNQSSTSTEGIPSLADIMKDASDGDKYAQNALGEMYKNGRGIRQDYHAAMEWFLKAANQGYPVAHINIANLYRYGHGVLQDFPTASKWDQLATDLKLGQGQTNIAPTQDGLDEARGYSQAAAGLYKEADDRGLV